MARMRKPIWSRTPIATLISVSIFATLAIVGSFLVGGLLFPFVVWSRNILESVLAVVVLVLIPDVGFVILARILASRLSGGKAALLTTLIAGTMALVYSWRMVPGRQRPSETLKPPGPSWWNSLFGGVVGVSAFVTLAFLWSLLVRTGPGARLYLWWGRQDLWKIIVITIVLVTVPDVGFAGLALFLADAFSYGMATLPTSVIIGALTVGHTWMVVSQMRGLRDSGPPT